MGDPVQVGYRFDGWRFHPATGELIGDDERTVLRPQVAAALELLLSRAGTLVTREDLRNWLWDDEQVVSFDTAISTIIRQLRKALRDNPREPRFVETIPRRGYRFLAAVSAEKNPRIPDAMHRLNPASRFRIAGAVALVLLALTLLFRGGPAPPPGKGPLQAAAPMLAVLPFNNLTGDAAHDVAAHFLTDAVIGYLSRVAPGELRVTGLASVLSYAGDRSGAAAFGEELGAAYVLEGSLLRSGNGAVVASVRLLETGDGTVIWSRDYHRAAPDPSTAARSIAALAAAGLSGAALFREPPGASREPSDAASEQFRTGLYIRDRGDAARTGEALDRFRRAVTLDPDFAAAHEALAETLIRPAGAYPTAERVEEGRSAARRALALDPLSATAHRVLGEIALYYDLDWEAARDHLQSAVDLAPSDANGHHALALWYSARGRHAEAVDSIELARALDPRSVAVSTDVMFVKFYARDWAGAITAAERLAEIRPGDDWHRRFVIAAELARDNAEAVVDEARAARLGWLERAGREPVRVPPTPEAEVRAYFQVLGDALHGASESRPVDVVAVAQWYAMAGDSQRAAGLVANGVDGRYFSYSAPFLGVSPMFDALRDSPSFQLSLRRLAQNGLAPADREAWVAALRPDNESSR